MCRASFVEKLRLCFPLHCLVSTSLSLSLSSSAAVGIRFLSQFAEQGVHDAQILVVSFASEFVGESVERQTQSSQTGFLLVLFWVVPFFSAIEFGFLHMVGRYLVGVCAILTSGDRNLGQKVREF